MTTIRVSAIDTAQAMDEIAARLGNDAMIIDTFKRNGKIEMIATDNPDEHPVSSKAPRDDLAQGVVLPYQNRNQSQMNTGANTGVNTGVNNGANNANVNMSGAEAMAEMQRANEEAMPSFTEIFDQKMISPAPATASSSTREAMGADNLSSPRSHRSSPDVAALHAELAGIKAMLNGMMITQPEGLKEQFGQTAMVKLRQAGFSPEVILALQSHIDNQPFDTAYDNFITAIANKLVRPDTVDLMERRLVCVVGGSGSGKTTLSSKIAAYCKENAIVDRITLASVTGKGASASDEIKDYARLMNMKSISFGIDELAERMRETSNRMIVDVSASPEQAVDAITNCCRNLGSGKVTVVQALPGGSSATMISHQCAHYFSLDPVIALTKLDECEAMPPELSALALDGTGIGLLTGTKSIVGGIAIATSQILTQYLRENA